MYLGFGVSVLVFSLSIFVQHANAIGDRRGGSSGYTRNGKLAFPFESSAQNRGFLGSSRSGAGGRVDRYSPEGSVSSYGSSSMDVRKPTQNSQQPRQTNPKARGVIQTKAGKWDFVSASDGKRFESGIASSGEIVMQAGPPPPSEPQPSVYQPGYPSSSGYQPQQSGQQPRYSSLSGYQPKPLQVGIQINPAISELFSPMGVPGRNVQTTNFNVRMTVPPRPRQIPMSSQHRPRWQRSVSGVKWQPVT